MRLTHVCILGCLVLGSACGGDEGPKSAPVRGLTTIEGKPITPKARKVETEDEEERVEQQATTPRRSKLPSPFQPGPGDLTGAGTPAAAAPEAPQNGEDKAAEEKKLSDALVRLLGTPASCLDLVAASKAPGGRVTIAVDAYVMASGFVSSATVSAAGQPAQATSCLAKRVENATLPGPIADAPRRIRGETTVEVVAANPSAPSAPAATAPVPTAPSAQPGVTPAPSDVAGPSQPGRADDVAGAP